MKDVHRDGTHRTIVKEVWLFTTGFPFGQGEPFLENELPTLCGRFEKVTIVPLFAEGPARSVPSNAEVFVPLARPYARASILQLILHAGQFQRIMRSLQEDAPPPGVYQAERAELRSSLRQMLHRAQVLERTLFKRYDPASVLLYSYWTYDWATVLGILRERDPRIRFISRVHGFDLYEQQRKSPWLPFRSFQLRHAERIFCVSQAGLDHLRAKHLEQSGKFELSRLGTRDHGLGPFEPTGPLRIVTCSQLIPRKRVALWIDVLRSVRSEVEWTHFGDGPERSAIENGIGGLPSNVHARIAGHRSNAELMEHYRSSPVDLFVHMSELEGGVAVALQEAASFGIPLLATDGGGIREIVNERTGRLLPLQPDVTEVARWIDGFREGSWSTATAREQVRAFWKHNFSAEAAYGRFCDRVVEIMT